MLNLLFPSHEGKQYFIRDICSGVRNRYKYCLPENSRLSSQQHKRCLDVLGIDIAQQSTFTSLRSSSIASLDLDLYQTKRGRGTAISQAYSFKEYMEFSLYDPTIGYYTTNPGIGRDFRTNPIRHSPHYGMWACELLFQFWIKMVDEQTLGLNEPFQIIEGGAGTGIFARDIIHYAASKRTKGNNSLRNKFYDSLFYLIIEISPELVKAQQKNLAKYEAKCAILCGDIRHLDNYMTEALYSKGFVLSNELPDAFSMHKVRRHNGQYQASIVFPVLNNLLQTNEKIVTCDRLIRQFLYQNSSVQLKGYLLSKDLYRQLSKDLSPKEIHQQFSWEELWVDAEEIEEIRKFISSHSSFFENMKKSQEYVLNTDLHHFQKTTSKLIKYGYKVTIDYQENNHTITSDKGSFRCYPGGIKHDFKILPGTYDITADVNASSLAEEGILSGWTPVFFGTEKMLLGIGCAEAVSQLARERMSFKVLIEKKGGDEAQNSIPFCSLPLTYRDCFVTKCDTLPKIFEKILGADEYTIGMIAHHIYVALLDLKLPQTRKFGRKEKAVLKRVYSSVRPLDKNIRKAIKLVFTSCLGKKSLLLMAKQYNRLSSVDLKNFSFVFDQAKTPDSVDYLAFLIIRHVLQMFFYFRNHQRMVPL